MAVMGAKKRKCISGSGNVHEMGCGGVGNSHILGVSSGTGHGCLS